MHVEALQPVRRTRLGKLTDLNRRVAAYFHPTWREAREVESPTRTADRMLFDERTLTSNDVAPSSLVLVDRQCCPEARADDPEASGPTPKCAFGRKPTNTSFERLSNRDTDLIVAIAHDQQRADFVVARDARPTNQDSFRVPVRFEFTDLHQRCAPLAATYCGPVEWLLPTVSGVRVRAGATGPVAEHRCR